MLKAKKNIIARFALAAMILTMLPALFNIQVSASETYSKAETNATIIYNKKPRNGDGTTEIDKSPYEKFDKEDGLSKTKGHQSEYGENESGEVNIVKTPKSQNKAKKNALPETGSANFAIKTLGIISVISILAYIFSGICDKKKILKFSRKILIFAVAILLTNISTVSAESSQSIKTKTDISLESGGLTIAQAPSFTFVVEEEVGVTETIENYIKIEDARGTGSSWTLRVALGEFTTSDGKQTQGKEIKLDAPNIVYETDKSLKCSSYPVTLVASKNFEYQTIAISPEDSPNGIWVGNIPKASLSRKEFISGADNIYNATVYWSIEDTP